MELFYVLDESWSSVFAFKELKAVILACDNVLGSIFICMNACGVESELIIGQKYFSIPYIYRV